MSIAELSEDKNIKYISQMSQNFQSMGSKEYTSTMIYDNGLPGSTVKFNYKLVKALVSKSSKSLREARTIYRELKIFNIFPLIQDCHELSIEEVIKMCQYIKYEVVKSGTILYKSGDPAEGKLYLLVSGQVTTNEKRIDVHAERINRRFRSLTQVQTDMQAIAKFRERRDSTRSKFGQIKPEKETFSPEKAPGSPNEERSLKFFSKDELKSSAFAKHTHSTFSSKSRGDVIGDSVLNGVEYRTETVIALTDCEFVLIDPEAILRAKNQYNDSDRDIHDVLYNYLPGLDKLVFQYLTDPLIRLFELVHYSRTASLTQEGEVGEYIYVIHEGDCDYFKTWNGQDPLFESSPLPKSDSKKKTNSLERAYKETHKLAVASTGSFVGEEVLFNKSGKYDYTVKIVSLNAKIFRIEKSNFLLQFPRESYQSLKKIWKQKQSTNEKTMMQKIKLNQEDFEVTSPKNNISFNSNDGFPSGLSIPTQKRVTKARTQTNSLDSNTILKTVRELTAEQHSDIKEKLQHFRRGPNDIPLIATRTITPRTNSPINIQTTYNTHAHASPRSNFNSNVVTAYPTRTNTAANPTKPIKSPHNNLQVKKETMEKVETTREKIKKMKFDFGFDYQVKRIRYKGAKKNAASPRAKGKELPNIDSKLRNIKISDDFVASPLINPVEEEIKLGRYFTEIDHDFEQGFAVSYPLKPKTPKLQPIVSPRRNTNLFRARTGNGTGLNFPESPKKPDILGLSRSVSPKSPEKSLELSPISQRLSTAHKKMIIFKTVTKINGQREVLKPKVIQAVMRKKDNK